MSLNKLMQFKDKLQLSQEAVLKAAISITGSKDNDLLYLANLHAMRILLPVNSTIRLKYTIDFRRLYFDENQGKIFCPGEPIPRYHPKLYPYVLPTGAAHPAYFLNVGLLFQKNRLRFISCHKDQFHWINQLNGMFDVFDLATWACLILSIFLATYIMRYVPHSISKRHKSRPFEKRHVLFDLVVSSLDQAGSVFGDAELRANPTFCFSFACIPLSLMYLGNLYKGDNITDLTLGPPLVSYDSFETLVEYQFETLVPAIELTSQHYASIKTHLICSRRLCKE